MRLSFLLPSHLLLGKPYTHEFQTFTAIDLGCDSLENNCMTQSQYHGYCLLYRRSCPRSEQVEKKLDSKTPKNSRKDCEKWKRKCAAKYPKHFACKQYKRKCGPIDFPIGKSSTSGRVQRMKDHRERKCAAKYPKHFACKQYKKNCGPIDFPIGNKTAVEEPSKRSKDPADDDNEEDTNKVKISKNA
ncbi:unnamed protein product [Haemonchus placei]|uniref:Kazal-like domain-containing protein n=1 Tax=Haemonchus placei TaxID=6290 RepID=A0A0N4VZG1_HAEPC|nr:unnamed protein product [Haemonchus placei]